MGAGTQALPWQGSAPCCSTAATSLQVLRRQILRNLGCCGQLVFDELETCGQDHIEKLPTWAVQVEARNGFLVHGEAGTLTPHATSRTAIPSASCG